MAIDFKIFTEKVGAGLKADKSYNHFLISVKRNNKLKRKTLDYSHKGWNKRDRERNARRELDKVIEGLESESRGGVPTLKAYWKKFSDRLPDTSWTQTKKKHFSNYIEKDIGSKKLDKLLPDHIEQCISNQKKKGLSPRTCNTTLEILRPLYKDAIKNRIVPYSPCDGVNVKIPKSKKIVVDASKRLKEIYAVIMDLFADDPYYRAIYLFALMGRRKSEILSRRWSDISFDHDYVVLEETKNGEIQKMYLSGDIKEALEEIYDKSSVWVFPSPVSPGSHIGNIEKTTAKIKKKLPYYTLHYSRNVIVSAMAEHGNAAVNMSGALGHMSAKTIDQYLTLNYLQGSKSASDTISKIVS